MEKTELTCAEAQDAVARGEVDRVFYSRCSRGIHLEDGGYKTTTEGCALHAKCDGGRCPDVGMEIE